MSSSVTTIEISDLETSSAYGFIINGADTDDYSGYSVSEAGDVNGDGLDDVIIGAYGADPRGSYSGASYVVLGEDSTNAIELGNLEAGTGNGFVINGSFANDYSGLRVSEAGDVNGDGLDDLVIGAYTADPDGNDFAGRSYVVFGTTETSPIWLTGLEAENGGGFVINGAYQGDYSGISVSGAGDVNGDGLDDVIIGAYGEATNGTNAGSSYVVFGSYSTSAIDLVDIEAGIGNGFVINGADASDYSGYSVSGAGDLNGDGLDDVIIGAYRANPNGTISSGSSYVVFGTTDSSAIELSDIESGAVKTLPSITGDGFVFSDNELTLTGSSEINATGDSSANILKGNSANNTLDGLGGNDIIKGLNGWDKLYGGDGNDKLIGGGKDDLLYGGEGNDKLIGGKGNDNLTGGAGRDTAIFGSGNNKIDLAITERQGTREGRDILTGIENVKGGDGNDLIKGDSVNNILLGEEDNDKLFGRGGNDTLDGGDGNDYLNGGLGKDKLIGGSGKDTFYLSANTGRDVITDYESKDKIKLTGELTENDLSIRQVGDNVKIKYDGDLMAIVQDTLISDLNFI